MSLKKEFNAIKKEKYPWVKEVTKYAAHQPFIQLNTAYKRYFKGISKKPRFKKKNKSTDSFYVGGDQIKIKNKKIWVPNLGLVRLKENLRFKGKINSASFSREGDRWFVSVQVEVKNIKKEKCKSNESVGVDLGINKMATISTGFAFDSPKPLKKGLRKLKRQQRIMSKRLIKAKKRKVKLYEAKNFQKIKLKVARTHARIKNIRKDTTHKLTTYLSKNYLNISIEDLYVRGMLKNQKLSRSLSDIGFGEIRRQLEYKAKLRGNIINLADRYFPSSKACSYCGSIKEDLALKDRIFKCDCGNRIDRDLNAAINLKQLIDNTNNNVRSARPEFTPVEITAMRKSVYPIQVTSIAESGSELHACVSRFG